MTVPHMMARLSSPLADRHTSGDALYLSWKSMPMNRKSVNDETMPAAITVAKKRVQTIPASSPNWIVIYSRHYGRSDDHFHSVNVASAVSACAYAPFLVQAWIEK